MSQINYTPSKQSESEVEQRFIELAGKIDKENWESPEYLAKLAQEIKEKDEELSKRVLVRVNNLNKVAKNKLENHLSTTSQNPVKTKQKNFPLASRLENNEKIKKVYKSGLFWFVILPSILFTFYQLYFATHRFESRAQLIVQQPDGMTTMDPSMALLSGFGIASSTTADAQLVKTYIYSKDMLDYLVKELNITDHFLTENPDVFSSLKKKHTQEELLEFYQKRVDVYIDDESSVITVSTQAYIPDYAQQLTTAIVKRAEWYINQIGNSLAEQQLNFVRGEHIKVEGKLSMAKNALLGFQERYNLLDPEAEGLALQQIAYGLEAKLVEKQSELSALTAIMSNNAPQVKSVRNEIRALQNQLTKERARLSNSRPNQANNDDGLSVSGILAKYAELKINLELALKAFTSSELSLEKARIETYRKLKYLVVVESPTLPEDNKYPKVNYNITLFMLLALMLYGIGRLILSTIREIK